MKPSDVTKLIKDKGIEVVDVKFTDLFGQWQHFSLPDDMFAYAESAASRGLRAIIAGAGGAAHLPGMLAAKTAVPVLGVPVASRHLQGVDSLHSIVQMPKGIPVATFAIGNAGAANAALFAVAMLATTDATLRAKLEAYRARQTDAARAMNADLK